MGEQVLVKDRSSQQGRFELVVEGTTDRTAAADTTTWVAYEFECKPGDPARRPCWASPYHYRLDWLMWFAGLEAPRGELRREAWVARLVQKLLVAEPAVLRLLDHDPFAGERPGLVRVQLYRYHFAKRRCRVRSRRLLANRPGRLPLRFG